jgi:hypothetical protein
MKGMEWEVNYNQEEDNGERQEYALSEISFKM